MAVNFEREEYKAAIPAWEMVDACCDEVNLGSLLLTINPQDKTPDNVRRNEDYKARASWFGAAAFTEAGLVGTAFEDPPQIELPGQLEELRTNCDGQGVDIQQQMQFTLAQVLRKGRCGLLVTYPQVEGGVSMADRAAGNARATIQSIDATRIINWWTVQVGAKVELGGVVFRDTMEEVEDFEIKQTPILRALLRMDGTVIDQRWAEVEGKWVQLGGDVVLRNGAGRNWQEIPFAFVGAFDNTSSIDRAPLLSLARLNRAHYRNSADFEEACFFAGNPQPWVSGWHQDDADTAKSQGFYLGSRQVIVCDRFEFAQAEANSMARQAMLDKQEQMKAIGARFLEPGTVAKTATEASGDARVQHSILSLAAANVEDAYNQALRWCSEYEGAGEGFVTMQREYMRKDVAIEKVNAFLQLWDRALVGPEEAHRVLTGANIVDPDKDAEDYAEELAARGADQAPVMDSDADDAGAD